MDEDDLKINADFLSIALEEMDAENYESAEEFVGDVYENLLNEIED